MSSEIQTIQESYGRAKTAGDLISRFYEIFLASHPDIGPRFKNTNMEQQKGLLRQGLNLAIMFANDNPVGKSGIARIRDSHHKDKLNIPPSLYKYWLDSLIKRLSEYDDQFTPDLEKQWRHVLQKSIDFIAGGYAIDKSAA